MKYRVIKILGPYNGPYAKNIITYFMEDQERKLVQWHEGPNKILGAAVADVLEGIVLNDKGGVDYRRSKPVKVISQLNLWDDTNLINESSL